MPVIYLKAVKNIDVRIRNIKTFYPIVTKNMKKTFKTFPRTRRVLNG